MAKLYLSINVLTSQYSHPYQLLKFLCCKWLARGVAAAVYNCVCVLRRRGRPLWKQAVSCLSRQACSDDDDHSY